MCSEHSNGGVRPLDKAEALGVAHEVIGLVPPASPTPSGVLALVRSGIPVAGCRYRSLGLVTHGSSERLHNLV